MKNVLLIVMLSFFSTFVFATTESISSAVGDSRHCPSYLNHVYRKLHSNETINLCDLYQGGPLLIVNTASHCGFTHQLKGLEALHKKYSHEGLVVIGFSSNDFHQAAKTEKQAAKICYFNHGVTFTMIAPSHVVGEKANPVFQYLAQVTSKQPSWNFNKYLIEAEGKRVAHYGSPENPLDSLLEKHIRKQLRVN